MPKNEILMAFGFVALFIMVLRHASSGRRNKLVEFEHALKKTEPTIELLEYSDTGPSETVWRVTGRVNNEQFLLQAIERRSGSRRVAWYTLIVGPAEGRALGVRYGGDNLHAREDQGRLSKLFGKVWPVCDYPRPVTAT